MDTLPKDEKGREVPPVGGFLRLVSISSTNPPNLKVALAPKLGQIVRVAELERHEGFARPRIAYGEGRLGEVVFLHAEEWEPITPEEQACISMGRCVSDDTPRRIPWWDSPRLARRRL